jgi:hypothetical protein
LLVSIAILFSPQSKRLSALRIKAFSRPGTSRFSEHAEKNTVSNITYPTTAEAMLRTDQTLYLACLLGADKRAGLLNLRHLPYVRDNLVQLPQALGFNPHNYVVQSVGDKDFGNLFGFPDFLSSVMLLATLHGGNHIGFHSVRHNLQPLTILYP